MAGLPSRSLPVDHYHPLDWVCERETSTKFEQGAPSLTVVDDASFLAPIWQDLSVAGGDSVVDNVSVLAPIWTPPGS